MHSVVESSSVEATARGAGWSVVLRGVIAVVFGVVALRSPSTAATAFVMVFALYAVADGILDFALAVQLGRAGRRWGWYLFEGIATVAVGVIAFAFPAATLVTLVLLIGLRAIVLGVFDLLAAFSWEGAESRWMLGLTGVLSIFLGVLLLGSPGAGGLALLWTIGVYAIVFGLMLFALGLRILSGERHDAPLQRPARALG
jgi:uncharacterized membrane protein HdeD (DUF308 family)